MCIISSDNDSPPGLHTRKENCSPFSYLRKLSLWVLDSLIKMKILRILKVHLYIFFTVYIPGFSFDFSCISEVPYNKSS